MVVQKERYLFAFVGAVYTQVASPSQALRLRSSHAARTVFDTAEKATVANIRRVVIMVTRILFVSYCKTCVRKFLAYSLCAECVCGCVWCVGGRVVG